MKLFNADAIVRSKDAGPFRFTLDVIFNDRNQFEAMKDSGIWNREYLCKLCRIPDSEVDECCATNRPWLQIYLSAACVFGRFWR